MSWPGGGMPPGWDMMGHNMGQQNPNQNQNPGAHPSANPYAGYGQQPPGMPPGYGSQPGYPPSQGYPGYPGQGQPSYGGQQPPGAGYPGMPGMNPQQSMGQHGWEHGMGQMMPGYPGHPGHPQYGQQKAPGRPPMGQNPMRSAAANYGGGSQQQLHQSQQSSGNTNVTSVYGQAMATPTPHQSGGPTASQAVSTPTSVPASSMTQNGFNQNVSPMPNFNFNQMSKANHAPFPANFGKSSSSSSSTLPQRTSPVDQVQNHPKHHQTQHMQPIPNMHQPHSQQKQMMHPGMHQQQQHQQQQQQQQQQSRHPGQPHAGIPSQQIGSSQMHQMSSSLPSQLTTPSVPQPTVPQPSVPHPTQPTQTPQAVPQQSVSTPVPSQLPQTQAQAPPLPLTVQQQSPFFHSTQQTAQPHGQQVPPHQPQPAAAAQQQQQPTQNNNHQQATQHVQPPKSQFQQSASQNQPQVPPSTETNSIVPNPVQENQFQVNSDKETDLQTPVQPVEEPVVASPAEQTLQPAAEDQQVVSEPEPKENFIENEYTEQPTEEEEMEIDEKKEIENEFEPKDVDDREPEDQIDDQHEEKTDEDMAESKVEAPTEEPVQEPEETEEDLLLKAAREAEEEEEKEEEERMKKRQMIEEQLRKEAEEEEADKPENASSHDSNDSNPTSKPVSEYESESVTSPIEPDAHKKSGRGRKKNDTRGITREAAAAAAAALVSDIDSNTANPFQPASESSNSIASPHDDDDFDYNAEHFEDKVVAPKEKKKPGRKPGRGRYPKVQATVMNPVKKKKKHDYDDDDDDLKQGKKSKKRRKIDSEEEFLNPEDYLEKRRSGRNQRGGRKNYDDNAVPNFVDSAGEEDDLISEVEGEHGVKIKKKIGKQGKKDEGEQLAEIIEDPLIVDKILSHRTAKRKRDDESVKSSESASKKAEDCENAEKKDSEEGKNEGDEVKKEGEEHKKEGSEEEELEEDEFFIKWKGYSYIHCVWLFRDEIFDPRFDQKSRRYYQKNGGMVDPDNEDFFNPDFVIVDRVLDVVEGSDPETGDPTRHYLVKWCCLPYDECTWELEADVDKIKIDLFHKLNGRKKNKSVERPPLSQWRKLEHPQEFKNKCILREYQVEGVSWLLFNWYQHRNCILADEMGLGKTIQSITFCQKIHDTGNRGPYLIVVPLSTVGNWIREFETWTDLNAIVYHGSGQSRQMIQQYEMFQRDKKGYPKKGDFRFDALITTYEMIVADCPELKGINWQLMIIDEAHRLKNTKSKLADNLKQMSIQHKVLLTGTPLQNNLEELYALLNFLNPEEFYDVGYFMREYGSMANKESVERMQSILKPIMLRRLKEDVEKSLKPKEETIIEVELTNIQKKYYRAIIERNFDFLSKGASSGNVPSLMNTMMELRKCCNHPFLIKGAEDKIMNDYKVKGEEVSSLHAMVQASGKMVLIHKLLPKLQAGGHKILIFSQMIRVLDILEDYLYQMNMNFERLDGRIRGNDRQAAIDRFSKPDSDRFVFLLCTRAGGLGINLTAADTVIIFDSDWNPQNDLQAQARCHRIGQKKEVKIYRLLTSKTYEREMFDRASLKLGLDRAVLQSMSGSTSGKDSGGPLSNMSKKEVEDLLKKGAYGAIMDDDDAAEKFCEEDIEQILTNRATTIKHEAGLKGSTFSKATFAGAADNRMDIDINDPDFWEKWARKADLDLDALTSNKLIIEQPRVRKQTQRYTGAPVDDHLMDELGSDSDSSLDGRKKRRRGDHFWGKKESFKLQKGLLMFGWGRWQDIIKHCKLSKSIPETGVEQISRAILALAASFYSGDDKVKQFIWELITPPEFTHELHAISEKEKRTKKSKRGRDSESPPPAEEGREWVIELDGLLTDDSFRKHVITHSNKLLARVKVLNYLRIEILADWLDHINDDVPSTEYELDVPVIEGDPPAPWWDEEADKSLLVGIFKHGYDRYSLIRNDPSLVFLEKVGPADDRALQADLMDGHDDIKTDKRNETNTGGSEGDKEYKPKAKNLFDEQNEILEAATNGTPPHSANQTPTQHTQNTPGVTPPQSDIGGIKALESVPAEPAKPVPNTLHLPWPPSADLNKRFRMIIAAYQRIFRRAQARAQRMLNRKPPRQINERWTKREESDFYRAVSTFGTERLPNGTFKWDRFRLVAKLEKKSDLSLTNYYIAFRAMCERTCRRSTIPEEDLPAVYVEQISEDRASRTLLRIHLLDRIRRECLQHPHLEKRLKLCQPSSDMPVWWIPGKHDKELLMGMNRHGLSRCEIHILNDKEFSFLDCLTKANKVPPRIVIKGEIKLENKTEIDEPANKSDAEKSKSPMPPADDQNVETSSPQPAKTPEQVTVNKTVETTEKHNESEIMETDKPETKENENNQSQKPVENGDVNKDGVEQMETENSEAINKSEEPIIEKPNTQNHEIVGEKVSSPKTPVETSKDSEKAKTPPPKSPEESTEVIKKERTSSPEPIKKEGEELSEDTSAKTPVIEVENEEEKALLEAELIKQQQLNKWPKDKFLMQRAEHVCFCITQGEWPTPKLINSLTGNVSTTGGGATFGGGLDSPRMSDSPASDYLRQNSSGLSSKHKVRGNHHPRSQSRTPIDPSGGAGLDASAHLLSKLNELAQGGQVSKEEVETLQQLLQQSAMLGLPIDAIMSQFQPQAMAQPSIAPVIENKTPQKDKKKIPKPHELTQSSPAMPKITQEQQLKLIELEKQLQDPTMQMLMANGLINPAALCGLDAETAKLLGIAPAPAPSKTAQGLKGLDAAALLNQPGMTPEMLQIMQMSLGQGLPGTSPSTPRQQKPKKRPLPSDSQKDSNSRPASRSSMASSSHRAPTPSGNEAKKRKSEDKIDIASLPASMKIPLIMADGTKMGDGVSNKELKGLLDSNPSIKVDYEALEAKLEKSRPKPSKSEQKAEQRAAQAAKIAEQHKAAAAAAQAAAQAAAVPYGDLASMGITPEIMAQFMNNGIDPKQLMGMANPFGASPSSSVKKPKANDPSQQKVQLVNLRTLQKLDRKKCPELCLLESFLKKNPDFFVASESKDFVLKHPKYFPRTLHQRIQPEMDHMGLGAFNDPKLIQAMMMQGMDPKAMSVLQAQQAMAGGAMNDPKLMAMLAMDPKMGMDPKMLQALGLGGGIDPKLLGVPGLPGLDPKTLGMAASDQKMMAALGMAGLSDPKSQQAQLQAQLQMQQQMALMGLAGMDPKALSSALGLGGAGLDAQTLAALTGMPGLDMKTQLQLQQQQQDMQAKALAQMMGGSVDPKLLGLPAGMNIPGLTSHEPHKEKKPTRTPTPKLPEEPKPASIEEIQERKIDEIAPVEEKSAPEGESSEAKPVESGENTSGKPAEKGPSDENGDDNKENEVEIETIPNGEDEKEAEHKPAELPKPSISPPRPSMPSVSVPTSMPEGLPSNFGIDAATMKALGSLGGMDPKTMKANGLDPALLKSLGLTGGSKPPTSQGVHGLSHGLQPGLMQQHARMEGLDNDTLKLLANGDAAAMQKLMTNPAAAGLMGLDPRMMGLDAQTMAALMAGQDPNKLMSAQSNAMSQANKQMEQAVLKQLGLDAQTVQAMQQQQLQQQQLAQMGMFGLGGMDPKMLQMMGMPQMDQKYLQGLQGIEQQILQQSMGYLGNMPGGLDAATMQQILGGAGAKGAVSKKGSTPRKGGGAVQQSLPQTSIPNLDILRQQEQLLLQMTGAAGMKPDLSAQELQALLAQQFGINY